jgi:hypothetical protein
LQRETLLVSDIYIYTAIYVTHLSSSYYKYFHWYYERNAESH